MKTQFTKGKWEAVFPTDSNGYWHVTTGLCEVATCYGDNAMNDANLIAAAPEMYEMLSEFINLVENDYSEDFLYKFHEVKELLAKACGE